MLKLQNIVKDYTLGDSRIHALKGIDLQFREHEFVAILGHSGCGKTTLLNIIGGLDQYSSGDLVINGKSTKHFSDSDWDSYRNHSVGFVFQSYNLIPHQSVLSNVELALTLSGVSKAERRERAVKVLEQVGLGDQLHKKPNQMSGGQMQRVAIARALINDPDILLADEPTGALDSETSVQIMEILKDIAKEKLIIMVTHNPELAELYATRTVKLLDGIILSDSHPYAADNADSAGKPSHKKPSMSFATALSLSLNNLLTKKARTFLTAFAGSIGIIGIALILSLSNGIQTYIDKVQEDTLSSYPITIEAETVDMSGLMSSMMGVQAEQSENRHENDAVYSSTVMHDMMNSLMSTETEKNNLSAFKEFIESDEEFQTYTSAIQYSYDLNLNIYAKDSNGDIVKADVTELMEKAMSAIYGGNYSSYFSTFGSAFTQMDVWEEMLPGEAGELISPLLKEQYDLLYGEWPKTHDEVVLIVNENNEVSDLVLYALGLKKSGSMIADLEKMMNMEQMDSKVESWRYDEICGMNFKAILDSEYYQYDSAAGNYSNISASAAGLDYLYHADTIGTRLTITGIIRPNADAVSTMMSGAIGYTSALTDHIIRRTGEMDIIQKQMAAPDVDVISGLPFLSDDYRISDEQKISDIRAHSAQLSTGEKAAIYTALMSVPDEAYVDNVVSQQMSQMTREYIEEMTVETYASEMGVDAETVKEYIAKMDDATLFGMVEQQLRSRVAEQYAAGVQTQMSQLSAEQLSASFDMGQFSEAQWLWMYEEYMPPTVSEGNYEDNLKLLGYVNLDSPKTIHIYASTFEDKDNIAAAITRYNESVSREEDEIEYTDYVALLMSSITTIINAISYVLVAFVAISLVVSSIMIGIITYISVLERTKEIGILRAIGASKRDISRVFNAETLIVGFVSGVLGIAVTLLLILPINAIVHHLTGIMSLNAILPGPAAAILVCISMILTFIAGLIPSGIAARKDPVEALRTE